MEKEHQHSHRHNESKKEGLAPNMKKFVNELSRVLDEKGMLDQLYITDGKRDPGASYGSSKSRHHHGEAIDIRPSAEVYSYLVNTREGNKLMLDYGVGIYDETDPKNMKYATGKHFHIGTDSAFRKQTAERWEYFLENPDEMYHDTPKQAYIAQDPDFNYENFFERRDAAGVTNSDNFNEWVTKEMSTYDKYMEPYKDNAQEFKIYSGVGQATLTPKKEIEKQQKVEDIKQTKQESDPNLMKLKQDQMKREAFMSQLSSIDYNVEREKSDPQQYSVQYSRIPVPQSQVVELPSIWQFPKYKDGGEVNFSELGYKEDSPDKDNPFNIINSNKITMKGVKHKVLGIDNLGNRKIMSPDKDYTFEGSMVMEIPLKNKRGKELR